MQFVVTVYTLRIIRIFLTVKRISDYWINSQTISKKFSDFHNRGGDFTDITERIFLLLSDAKIEQKVFAKEIGVSPQTITDWKNGKSKSYTKFLPQIAEALNTTTEYLLFGNEKQPATGEGDGPSENEILFRKLSPDLQEEALRYMRYLAAQSDKSEGSGD